MGLDSFEYFDLKATATTHDYDQVKTTINVLTDNDNKSNDEPVNNALTSENHDNNNNIDNSEQFDINCQSMIFTSELHYTIFCSGDVNTDFKQQYHGLSFFQFAKKK